LLNSLLLARLVISVLDQFKDSRFAVSRTLLEIECISLKRVQASLDLVDKCLQVTTESICVDILEEWHNHTCEDM
jgi:hypothetical protein